MTIDDVFKNAVGPYGAIFLLVIAAVTGFWGKWVFSTVMENALKAKDILYHAVIAEKDEQIKDREKQLAEAKAEMREWKNIALRALRVTDRSVGVSEKAVKAKDENDG